MTAPATGALGHTLRKLLKLGTQVVAVWIPSNMASQKIPGLNGDF